MPVFENGLSSGRKEAGTVVLNKIAQMVIGILLVWYTWTDLKTKTIWWPAAAAAAVLGLLLHLAVPECSAAESLQGMTIGAVLFLLAKATGGAIGTGDSLTMLACGAWMGFGDTLNLLLGGLCLASVWAIVLLLRRKQKNTSFPFIPFLLAAHILQMITGG